jgi:Holliday junction resolvase RusA-like endonuclease
MSIDRSAVIVTGGRALDFEVLGVPAPQGSKTRMPNGAMLDGGSKAARISHRAWREAVAGCARDIAGEHGMYDEALYFAAEFRFPMPKSRRKADRERGWCWKTSAPDIDKLLRNTFDGLKDGGLIRDDALICRIGGTGRIEVRGWTGARIWLEPVEETP